MIDVLASILVGLLIEFEDNLDMRKQREWANILITREWDDLIQIMKLRLLVLHLITASSSFYFV